MFEKLNKYEENIFNISYPEKEDWVIDQILKEFNLTTESNEKTCVLTSLSITVDNQTTLVRIIKTNVLPEEIGIVNELVEFLLQPIIHPVDFLIFKK